MLRSLCSRQSRKLNFSYACLRSSRVSRVSSSRKVSSFTFTKNTKPLSPLALEYKYPITFSRCFASDGDEIVIKVPSMGDSITSGTLERWSKEVGEGVDVDEVVASIETDKVQQEIKAPYSGTITALYAEADEDVQVGADLFAMKVGEAPKKSSKPAEETTPPPAAQSSQGKASNIPPPTTGMAAKAAAAPQASTQATPPPPPPPPPPPSSAATQSSLPPVSGTASRGETRVKMNRMRARIAQRLKDSQNTYALLTTFQECDLHNLMQLRQEYKDEFLKKHDVKLGFMSAFVKASAAALKANPVINAVIDGNEIVYRDYVDISVAVATPKGLVVPVLKDCDTKSFADVEKTIADLGRRARDGNLGIEEMSGGTFTISNGGVYGSLMGTPIVNPPQSAILGMHAINKRAVVINDEITIRPMMYLALTYDHRLIDGRDAVTFLRQVKHAVEDPRRLLLDL